MHVSERTLLLDIQNRSIETCGLSIFFAIICIIDVFGVFPIVTLPKAIINCGFYGILIILLVCSIQIYTAILLGKCWVIAEEIDPLIYRKNRYPYSALAEITYGKRLSNCVSFLLDLTIFGGGIPNLIVASQNLQLFGLQISDDNVNISYCYWIILLGAVLCPLLWLGSPKDMNLHSKNYFALALNRVTAAPVGGKGIIPSTKIQKWAVVTLCMFGVTTTITSIKYGNATQPSILETLPTTIPLHFAAILVALQLCLTSAVSNSALYQHMEDCLSIASGKI
ncbi:hypothetical protein NQ314_003880 [Rhamnusium bicolor]|uniref:Amino acid transporter transmembrane domain-containing protein n=1 Tax=Rhamnusium bicolor TaxID=1586634 RepID=A0AAV8ZNP3_9CUCU|nr:hypothetical protein NQ314_003880 [Rhamnusium bicolor]